MRIESTAEISTPIREVPDEGCSQLLIDGDDGRRTLVQPEGRTLALLVAQRGSMRVAGAGRVHEIESSQWCLFDGEILLEVEVAPIARGLCLRYARGLLEDPHRRGPAETDCSVWECLCCPQRNEAYLASGRVDGRLRSCLSFLTEAEETLPARLFLQAKRLEALSVVLGMADANKCPRKGSCCEANTCCLREAACLLEKNLAEDHSIRSLSRAVGTNEFALKRGFRQLYQTTVFGYLREKRMDRARELFEQGRRRVTDVAGDVGYSNTSHFAAAFRRQFGMNPKAFVKHLELVGGASR